MGEGFGEVDPLATLPPESANKPESVSVEDVEAGFKELGIEVGDTVYDKRGIPRRLVSISSEPSHLAKGGVGMFETTKEGETYQEPLELRRLVAKRENIDRVEKATGNTLTTNDESVNKNSPDTIIS